jgi:glyoxalase family protein
MNLELPGLHHWTAITAQARNNLTFYTEVLGLRLIKKTVNQDDVSAYHLFYGDEQGSPGTELTFFDWPHAGPTRYGAGIISSTGLRVGSAASLEWWRDHLTAAGVTTHDIVDRYGRKALPFTDPEGQRLELIDDEGAAGSDPWDASPIPAEHWIKGLHSVRLTVDSLDAVSPLFTQVLGWREDGRYDLSESGQAVVVFAMGAGGAGAEVHVEERPDLPRGRAGAGGVHHIAFRVRTEEEHRAWVDHLRNNGVRVTDVIDRFYFRSMYFPIPSGILFELATDGPGFATDEPVETLGEKLALPPFLEPRRAEIEAGLKPLD